MDSETALELVKHGATIVLLDVPLYTMIGIDTQAYSSGPNFMGIKMIPPGVHFVYYSCSNREGSEFSPVFGSFIIAQPSQVIIYKWEKQEEHLAKLSEDEEVAYMEAVKRMEFDRQLGPYDLHQYGDWKRLSNYITKDSIERIEPIGGVISVTFEADISGNLPRTAMERALDKQLESSKFSHPTRKFERKGCFYTTIPRVVKQQGFSGQDLTRLNLDKTHLLETILAREYGGVEDLLLAELQFSFIAFLMGQSLEAFLQWKQLTSLLFGCSEAPLRTRSQLYIKLVRVLHYQLTYGFQRDQIENGIAGRWTEALMDESWLSADSFLYHLCKDFFALVLEAPGVNGDLLSSVRKLKELLENSLGWKFQQNIALEGALYEKDDEFAPVIVTMDE